jgi:hypothetical protein
MPVVADSTPWVKVLQINLQRSSTAQSLLQQTSIERGVHILAVSEPNWHPAQDDRWVRSDDGTCAVALTAAADFVVETHGAGRGYAWIQGRGLRVYSCYNSRNDTAENFADFLDDVHRSTNDCDRRTQLIICGDFNSWSQDWGSARNDQRGDQLADLAASLGLSVENTGDTATYRRINAESIIDITFSRLAAPAVIRGWSVLEDVESSSDHRYVEFTLLPTPVDDDETDRSRPAGWSYRQLDPAALATYLANTAQPVVDVSTTATEASDQLIDYLTAACDSCMPPRAIPRPGRRSVHWWSNDLATLRRSTFKARRAAQRSARRRDPLEQTDVLRSAYTEARKTLRDAIRAAQAKSWAELCRSVDNDPWGLPYRVVTKKISRKRPGVEARGRENSIADHLFPEPPPTDWASEPRPTNDAADSATPLFTTSELREACLRLPPGKATGPDGIPNEILLRVARIVPQVFLEAFNRCLSENKFPERWKISRLVLLRKGPDKPVLSPSSFRPLCMLNSTAKLLERLILIRLNEHLDSTGQRCENQFGFRHGRSTEDAIERVIAAARGAAACATQHRDICVVVSLDVRNAFNTVPWPRIDAALRRKKVPAYINLTIRSYLENRTILVGEARTARSTTCGVPQGSVLGPSLWNTFYDDLLDTNMPPGVQLIAFADDVAVIGTARTGQLAATLLNPVLETVNRWMGDNGLTVAPHKSEAVVLTGKYSYTDPELHIEGHAIPVKPSIRYLGVELDTRLSFTAHIAAASRKATESAKVIGRLMPNIGGPAQAKRALLGSVTNSKLLYASPVWATVGTKTAKNRNAMARAQRTTAIRTIRAYRTVSADVSSILSSMPPADLLAHERARVNDRMNDVGETRSKQAVKHAERIITTRSWQARWDRSATSPDAVGRRWTHRLLPDISRWLSKPPMDLTFHLTQALTAHGCFRSYLKRFNRAEDGHCVYCMDPEDTAEHTLFACPRWEEERATMQRILRRPLHAGDVEEILCGPRPCELPDEPADRSRILIQAKKTMIDFVSMVEKIMTTKEADEREDQQH